MAGTCTYTAVSLQPSTRQRLLEKLPVAQLLKKFPALYRRRVFITVITSAHQEALSWLRWIQSMRPCFSKKDGHYSTVLYVGTVYCVQRTECVQSCVRKDVDAWPLQPSGYYIYTFSNSTFCPHSVFMCSVWLWEQTAIISLYSINWLVFITVTGCLLRGTIGIYI